MMRVVYTMSPPDVEIGRDRTDIGLVETRSVYSSMCVPGHQQSANRGPQCPCSNEKEPAEEQPEHEGTTGGSRRRPKDHDERSGEDRKVHELEVGDELARLRPSAVVTAPDLGDLRTNLRELLAEMVERGARVPERGRSCRDVLVQRSLGATIRGGERVAGGIEERGESTGVGQGCREFRLKRMG
jgi:hypothetical protein